ncbi:MAG: DUF6438 domain-containing protein [Actinomycetota bacterium]|nr:DUF6438 domain-containing protein [Actinomycetota bacterium]
MTLRSDGTADWNGERFVDRIGRFHGQLDMGDFENLAGFIRRAGFFGWDEEFSSGATDAPDYELVVVAGDQVKRVRQNASDEPPDFWVIAALVDGLTAAIDWMAGALAGTCGQWSATLTTFGIAAPLLSVRGVCTFPTTGYEVELRRHRPQTGDPRTLVLDRVVTAPTGPEADVITEVEVSYSERNVVETVTILPDAVTVVVVTVDEPQLP